MKMSTAIELFELQAGGPGSGCNPDKGKCGRHPGSKDKPMAKGKKGSWPSPADKYKNGSVIYKMFDILKDGKKHYTTTLQEKVGTDNDGLFMRFKTLQKQGDTTENWNIITGWGNNGRYYQLLLSKKGKLGKNGPATKGMIKITELKPEPEKKYPQLKVLKGTALEKFAQKQFAGKNIKAILGLTSHHYGGADDGFDEWDSCHPNCNPKSLPPAVRVAMAAGLTPSQWQSWANHVDDWAGAPTNALAKAAQKALFTKDNSPMSRAIRLDHMLAVKALGNKKTVTLYRGVGDDYAKNAVLQAMKGNKEITLKTRGADSWADDPSEAENFGTIRLKAEIPVEYIATSHLSNSKLHDMAESEFIVAFPKNKFKIKSKDIHLFDVSFAADSAVEIDLTNDDNFDWRGKRK